MTLDEAIEHASEKAEACSKCADEHKQLANWLVELNRIKNSDVTNINRSTTESLAHYYCGACYKWWTIRDGDPKGTYYCPHCGVRQSFR